MAFSTFPPDSKPYLNSAPMVNGTTNNSPGYENRGL